MRYVHRAFTVTSVFILFLFLLRTLGLNCMQILCYLRAYLISLILFFLFRNAVANRVLIVTVTDAVVDIVRTLYGYAD